MRSVHMRGMYRKPPREPYGPGVSRRLALAALATVMVPGGAAGFLFQLASSRQVPGPGASSLSDSMPPARQEPTDTGWQRSKVLAGAVPRIVQLARASAALVFLAMPVVLTRRSGCARASCRLRGVTSMVVPFPRSHVSCAAELSVSQLAQRLRERGVPKTAGGKSSKLGHIFADFVEKLQEAMEEAEEETEEVRSDEEGLMAQLQQLDPQVTKADYFDSESGVWDTNGLREDLELARERSSKAAEPVAEEPDDLFARLAELDPGVSKEDYFDEESGTWDTGGLQSDLELIVKRGVPVAAAEPEAPASVPQVQELLTELMALDANVTKADYFDEDSEQWDLDGLKEDLELARQRTGSSSSSDQQVDDEGERLFVQLSNLDVNASRDDYFDAESGEWDLEGLQDDLGLVQGGQDESAATSNSVASAPLDEDPEALLARLIRADPQASREDYFDEESGQWDIEGIKDDLSLAVSTEDSGDPDLESPMEDDWQAESSPTTAATELSPETGQGASEEIVAISVGDHVNAKYLEEGWYTAVVTKDNRNGTFQLKWDEDSTETAVSCDLIQVHPPIVEGATVYAIWEEDGGWYDAVVQKVIGDNDFVVKYDEDASEATLHRDKVRMKVDPPKEPQYWFAPYSEGQSAPATGEHVEALWKDGDYAGWHAAVVQKDNGDGSFQVKWDEDNSETAVQRNDMRKREARIEVSSLQTGQKLKGIVANTTTFGAFVDVGAENEGLVHISNLSRNRVESVEDVVQSGQAVDVWVASVNPDGKLGLTMVKGGGSDLSDFESVPPDQWLPGKVVQIERFGAFVTVTPPGGGPEQRGMVHISEIRDGFVEDVNNELKVGQQVQVRVAKVEGSKLQLSMTSY